MPAFGNVDVLLMKDRSIDAAPRACCCYTIDKGYLMPTLLSASQLRLSVPPSVADVVVVCFGQETTAIAEGATFCASQGIHFMLVPMKLLDGAPMICARFFLSRILDPIYGAIVYLDGDTQIAGSLEPLITYGLSSGQVLAAPDPMSVMIDSPRPLGPPVAPISTGSGFRVIAKDPTSIPVSCASAGAIGTP